MSALFASDLDRTLIYSQQFFAETSDPRVCVEVFDGRPISFMTPAAVVGLQRLVGVDHLVPTTTRTVEQYRRIELPGRPYRLAITSNGGTILVDGEPDRTWETAVAARIRDGGLALVEILVELRRRVDTRWVRNLRVAEDLFCYLVVDESVTPANFVGEWTDWCGPQGWKVSQQGRKIYTVPQSLCKSHAVDEVRRRLIDNGTLAADAPVIAAGDGALDAEMLVYADAAIRPAHGELHALAWQSEHLVVTQAAGAHAAEEILEWFSERSSLGYQWRSGSAGLQAER